MQKNLQVQKLYLYSSHTSILPPAKQNQSIYVYIRSKHREWNLIIIWYIFRKLRIHIHRQIRLLYCMQGMQGSEKKKKKSIFGFTLTVSNKIFRTSSGSVPSLQVEQKNKKKIYINYSYHFQWVTLNICKEFRNSLYKNFYHTFVK